MGTNHRIHFGFLFHVNFYHAGLGDTNDDRGFGRDLARIRDILDILAKANNEGQPVRAAWDFENDYTLGRILPSLGPDVIDGVKTRLRERGDELLFSGKHAGLFAGMTGKELSFALHYKSNELGETSNVLRPEGDLFSPAIIGRLKKAGIEAVLLGNSNVGPNALSTVTKDLRKNTYVKYNPATYRHGNNSITVLPYYTPADFLEEGSLKKFLDSLHNKQLSGEIDGDVFVLVGADVRSPWWEDMEIRNIFRKSSGTEGLSGFIKALRKFDYIAYNTPTGYLKEHAPVSEISFAGDLAGGTSGDFSAYSELPYDRLIWTRIERARMGSRVYSHERVSDTLAQRIKLLSASEFGLFSPAPAKDRFAEMDRLSVEIQKIERKAINEKEMSMRTSGRQRLNNSAIGKHLYSRRKDDEERNSFIIMNPKGQRVVSFQLLIDSGQCPKIGTLVLECDECQIRSYTAVEMSKENGYVNSAFVVMRFAEAQGTYKIYYHFDRSDIPKEPHKPLIELKPEDHPVFHAEGAMKRLLEAQGKLKAAPPPSPDDGRRQAVANRIAEINSAQGVTRAKTLTSGGERDSYVISSPDQKLRIVISGMGATKGHIREVFYDDERIGDNQFLSSFVKSGGTVSEFTCEEIKDAELAGEGMGVTISGTVHAGGESAPGRYELQIIKTAALKGIDGILLHMDVTYPSLEGVGEAFLEEIAPLQISPQYRAGVSVIRRSFNGIVGDYPVSVFGKSVPGNENIASFNHQMTAGIVGAKGALSGILIGIPRTVLGGLAICPGRLLTDGEGQHLNLNPYGTYGIQSKKYPSESEGVLQKYADSFVNEKPINTASAYSGVREKFCMCLAGFAGANPSEGQLLELSAFCDGAIICGDETGVIHPFEGDNVTLPRAYKEIPIGTDKREEHYNSKNIKTELAKFLSKKRR
ncbi:hypothetical protein SAMN04487770_10246 [Butyrivibrio sp. ob235]|uniref:hypothetical protein n=1 Tax=Butyrivibrio sp. ob235 TaxID=1761780 RepID=UPI0008BF62D5|nr:hypothetical protein [Butyrivibrio sp. ob235]SEK59522.1 hypothetical protein SAMN04487770_10246 [Butyrivibrio sp. ob235]